MATDTTDIKCIVEAIIFMSPRGVSLKKIEKQLPGVDKDLILCAIYDLIDDYDKRNTAIKILFEDDYIEMITKKEYFKYNSFAVGKQLSKGELKTLALIAINKPSVEQSKIVSKRPYDHLSTLKEIGLISVTKKGRKNMLSVTKKFDLLFNKKIKK
jgi:segregation and condensation protein B